MIAPAPSLRASTLPRALAFWAGVALIVFGVLAHLAMFAESADMGYRMTGMPADVRMIVGMTAIVLGIALGAYGLLVPRAPVAPPAPTTADAPRGIDFVRAMTLATLTLALVIDVMKPATLAFVAPGMMHEYGITKPQVALLPVVALSGTVIGSVLWGIVGDVVGRRAAIVLAALIFVATSICGTMPSFAWNLVMCSMMGASAGGLIPIAYTILSEILDERRRRLFLVLIGGWGAAGGYLAASGFAYLLEPHFTWRALWIVGFPTGLLLIALSPFIPETPAWLGRRDTQAPNAAAPAAKKSHAATTTFWLNSCAVAWSAVNFGFIFWLPTNLREMGFAAGFSDGLLARSALFSLASTPVIAFAYQKLGRRWTVASLAVLQGSALLVFAWFGRMPHGTVPVPALIALVAVLLIATNGFICVLLPFAAESYATKFRGTGTGVVAGSSKIGGLIPVVLAKLGWVPTLAISGLVSGTWVLLSAAGLTAAFLAYNRSDAE